MISQKVSIPEQLLNIGLKLAINNTQSVINISTNLA